MPDKLQSVRGTKDLFGADYLAHQNIINKAYSIAELYGYIPAYTPILEFTDVFQKTLGETADVITKEMYSFTDRGGENVTLRPEFTAAIARSFISNGLAHKLPLKLFSSGPLFRYERPQKGRQRQFHQINMECLGFQGPAIDSETIAMAVHILKNLNVLEYAKLELNSLGDQESRVSYHAALKEYFSDFALELSEDSKIRLLKNPLRILDSKKENDRKIIANAPICFDYYTNSAKVFFDKLKEYLDALSITYNVNPRLVRGLDYYNHTAFEFITDKLGAQGTVLAGGRYDTLIESMGGPSTPAIGFAAGIERLSELTIFTPTTKRPIVIMPVSEEFKIHCYKLANILRYEGFFIEVITEGDFSKKMKKANKINASVAIFIGENEVSNDSATIKVLDSKQEKLVSMDKLIDYIGLYKL